MTMEQCDIQGLSMGVKQSVTLDVRGREGRKWERHSGAKEQETQNVMGSRELHCHWWLMHSYYKIKNTLHATIGNIVTVHDPIYMVARPSRQTHMHMQWAHLHLCCLSTK